MTSALISQRTHRHMTNLTLYKNQCVDVQSAPSPETQTCIDFSVWNTDTPYLAMVQLTIVLTVRWCDRGVHNNLLSIEHLTIK